MKPVSVSDYRAAAKASLPHFLFEYLDGGAHGETTLARNRSDLDAVQLRQRVMRDVSSLDLSCELFGEQLSMPVALGPIGLSGLMARRGEVQAARAAAAAGVPFCLSAMSACSIGEVKAAGAPFWFQLYMLRDREFMRELLAQAAEEGVTRLVFTVDMPVPGTRYRDYRSGLAGAPGLGGDARRVWQGLMRPGWAWDVGVMGRPHSLGNVAAALGADAVLLGRAWAYALAGGGEAGVAHALELIRAEMGVTLALTGVTKVSGISSEILVQ